MTEQNFVYADANYLKELEETAKKVDYYKGIIDGINMVIDRKTENSSEKPNNCDTCRHKGVEGCEQPCLGCNGCGLYEPKDEPQTDCTNCDQVGRCERGRAVECPMTERSVE